MACRGMKAIKVWTHKKLREAVDQHKWYLSEIEHHDVGLSVAELDFLHNHVAECGATWRVIYCGSICKYKGECETGRLMVERDRG